MKARVGLGVFIGIGLLVALSLAFVVSPQASSQPDGLEKVAIDKGFSDQEKTHSLDGVPTAGYGVEGVGDDRLSTGLAGLIGVTVTFAIAGGLLLVVRRASRRGRSGAPSTSAT